MIKSTKPLTLAEVKDILSKKQDIDQIQFFAVGRKMNDF